MSVDDENILQLEKEVADLTARRDIYNAICNYMRGQDRLEWETQRSAFHDDADVDCGMYRGNADGYTDFAQGVLKEFESSQHLIGQAHIDVNGNEASGEVYFIAFHRVIEADNNEKDLIIGGRYIDRYEKRDGKWRISKRRELVDWARTDPAADSFILEETKIWLGARGKEDFSSHRDYDK